MTPQDIGIYVAAVAGVLSLLWGVWQAILSGKRRRTRALNRNVLAPWSEVELKSMGAQGFTDMIGLAVPKRSVASEAGMDPWERKMQPAPLMKIEDLPGLSDGEAFLRRRHPEVTAKWDEVQGYLAQYEGARKHRRETMESMVTKDMATSYPNLTADPWLGYKENSYMIVNIVMAAEENGYTDVDAKESLVSVTQSQQQIGDRLCYNLNDGRYRYPLLFGVSHEDADQPKMTKLLSRWIADPAVREDNEEMSNQRAMLEKTVPELGKLLKEAVVRIEVDAS